MSTVSHKRKKYQLLLPSVILGIIVLWLALLIAPYVSSGIPGMLQGLGRAIQYPLRITLCPDSLRTVLVCETAFGLGMAAYASSRRNYRRGEEYGSADWGEVGEVNRKYSRRPREQNKILTRHISISLDTGVHRRNLNTGVIGGSGAGKTYSYVKPNLIQGNTSFVVTDPKGGATRS